MIPKDPGVHIAVSRLHLVFLSNFMGPIMSPSTAEKVALCLGF